MQESILKQQPATSNSVCSFKETNFDPTLRDFVDKACKYGILIGGNGEFRPKANISKPEFATALVRMIE
jgi:hypothetical protein